MVVRNIISNFILNYFCILFLYIEINPTFTSPQQTKRFTIMKTLTTEFTKYELKNLHTHILEDAKRMVSDKITFHQNEINTGHCSQYHIDQLNIYSKDFQEWALIVSDARQRDTDDERYFFNEMVM